MPISWSSALCTRFQRCIYFTPTTMPTNAILIMAMIESGCIICRDNASTRGRRTAGGRAARGALPRTLFYIKYSTWQKTDSPARFCLDDAPKEFFLVALDSPHPVQFCILQLDKQILSLCLSRHCPDLSLLCLYDRVLCIDGYPRCLYFV